MSSSSHDQHDDINRQDQDVVSLAMEINEEATPHDPTPASPAAPDLPSLGYTGSLRLLPYLVPMELSPHVTPDDLNVKKVKDDPNPIFAPVVRSVDDALIQHLPQLVDENRKSPFNLYSLQSYYLQQHLPENTGDAAAVRFFLLRNSSFFVDKTSLLKDWLQETNGCDYILRPQGFGKTSFLDLLQCLYEGRHELFKGTYLEDNWDWQQEPTTVLRIDLGQALNYEKWPFAPRHEGSCTTADSLVCASTSSLPMNDTALVMPLEQSNAYEQMRESFRQMKQDEPEALADLDQPKPEAKLPFATRIFNLFYRECTKLTATQAANVARHKIQQLQNKLWQERPAVLFTPEFAAELQQLGLKIEDLQEHSDLLQSPLFSDDEEAAAAAASLLTPEELDLKEKIEKIASGESLKEILGVGSTVDDMGAFTDLTGLDESFAHISSWAPERTALVQISQLLRACAQHSRVLLIDNIDSPLWECLTNWEQFNQRSKFINALLTVINRYRSAFVRIVITAIMPVTQFVNPRIPLRSSPLPISHRFSCTTAGSYFGFTLDDVMRRLYYWIEHAQWLANGDQAWLTGDSSRPYLTKETIAETLKRQYGGYSFDHGQTEVLNPVSVILYLRNPGYERVTFWANDYQPMMRYLMYGARLNLRTFFERMAELANNRGWLVQRQEWHYDEYTIPALPVKPVLETVAENQGRRVYDLDVSKSVFHVRDGDVTNFQPVVLPNCAYDKKPWTGEHDLIAFPYAVSPYLPLVDLSSLPVAAELLRVNGFTYSARYSDLLDYYRCRGVIPSNVITETVLRALDASKRMIDATHADQEQATKSKGFDIEKVKQVLAEMRYEASRDAKLRSDRIRFEAALKYFTRKQKTTPLTDKDKKTLALYESLMRKLKVVESLWQTKKQQRKQQLQQLQQVMSEQLLASSLQPAPVGEAKPTAAASIDPLAVKTPYSVKQSEQIKDGVAINHEQLTALSIKDDVVQRQEQIQLEQAQKQQKAPVQVSALSRGLRDQIYVWAQARKPESLSDIANLDALHESGEDTDAPQDRVATGITDLSPEMQHRMDLLQQARDQFAANADPSLRLEKMQQAHMAQIATMLEERHAEQQAAEQRRAQAEKGQEEEVLVGSSVTEEPEERNQHLTEIFNKIAAQHASEQHQMQENVALSAKMRQQLSLEQTVTTAYTAAISCLTMINSTISSALMYIELREALSVDASGVYQPITLKGEAEDKAKKGTGRGRKGRTKKASAVSKEAASASAATATAQAAPEAAASTTASAASAEASGAAAKNAAQDRLKRYQAEDDALNKALQQSLAHEVDMTAEAKQMADSGGTPKVTAAESTLMHLSQEQIEHAIEVMAVESREEVLMQARAFYLAMGAKVQLLENRPHERELTQLGYGELNLYQMLAALGYVRMRREQNKYLRAYVHNDESRLTLRYVMMRSFFHPEKYLEVWDATLHKIRDRDFLAKLDMQQLLKFLNAILESFTILVPTEVTPALLCQLFAMWFALNMEESMMTSYVLRISTRPIAQPRPDILAAALALEHAQKMGFNLKPEQIPYCPEFYSPDHQNITFVVNNKEAIVLEIEVVRTLGAVPLALAQVCQRLREAQTPLENAFGVHYEHIKHLRVRKIAIVCYANRDICRIVLARLFSVTEPAKD